MPSRTANQQRSPATGKRTTSHAETTATIPWRPNHGKQSGTRNARNVDKNACRKLSRRGTLTATTDCNAN
eukprot:8782875-Lingulodinium_polyedra.AAC.1